MVRPTISPEDLLEAIRAIAKVSKAVSLGWLYLGVRAFSQGKLDPVVHKTDRIIPKRLKPPLRRIGIHQQHGLSNEPGLVLLNQLHSPEALITLSARLTVGWVKKHPALPSLKQAVVPP
jgi:hypothetical protein